ncbi:MAG: response regulator [Gammaproteobacteria bacterium]
MIQINVVALGCAMLWNMGRSFRSDTTVVVIDDDSMACDALTALIGALGVAVRAYSSAEAFLFADAGKLGDCLIIEANLPGMSGLQLIDQLRRQGDRTPIIVLADDSDVPTAVKAMRIGAFDFFAKPVVERLLLTRVQEALSLKQRQADD